MEGYGMTLSGKYLSEIIKMLTIIRCEIKSKNRLNLTDDNIVMQDFMCKILNMIYNYNLINLNDKNYPNFPGIDLGDEGNEIGFQITSTKSGQKIKDTLDICVKNQCCHKYKNIKFFILTDKQKKYTMDYTSDIFSFDKKLDILDFDDLFSDISSLTDIDIKRELHDYIKQEIPYYSNDFSKIAISININKIVYPCPANYIKRDVILCETLLQNEYYYLYSDKKHTLEKITEQNKLIVLLGDAGSGKSIELQYLAHKLSTDKGLFPIYYKLNNYIDKTIEEFIPTEYKDIPIDKLVFILDGFDEIKEQNVDTFRFHLEEFVEENPNTKFVISSRSNFYKMASEDGKYSGTIVGFQAYSICPLTIVDRDNYLVSKGIPIKDFVDEIVDKNLRFLIKLPFYLIEIANLYYKYGKLPKRTELMEFLIKNKFKIDVEKFRSANRKLPELEVTLMWLLKKTGTTLECLGRNYLTETEYQILHASFDDRELLKHSGIWIKNNKEEWQFVHNNFGEYLAAKWLQEKTRDEIISCITYSFDKKTIKPSWANTLSFLADINKNDELLNWALENSPNLVMKFEKDRVEKDTRIRLFKNIFTSYGEKAMWLRSDEFSNSELVEFGGCKETLLFLLEKIKDNTNYFLLSNALVLLIEFKELYGKNDAVIEVLTMVIFDDELQGYERSRAIVVLARHELQSKDLTQRLVLTFKEEDDSWIRHGIYAYLSTSVFLDSNIDFFLDGLKYDDHGGSDSENVRLGNELFELFNGIIKINTLEAFVKVIDYIEEIYNEDSGTISDELIKNILTVAERFYSRGEKVVFEHIFKLFVNSKRYENNKDLLNFFDNTDTRIKAFVKLAQENNLEKVYLLEDISNDKCIHELTILYKDGKIDGQIVIEFAKMAIRDTDELDELVALIKEKTGVQITRRAYYDNAKWRKKGIQSFFDALFNKAEFQELIDDVVRLGGRPNITRKEAKRLPYKLFREHEDLREVKGCICYGWEDETQEIAASLETVDWVNFQIRKILKVLEDKQVKVDISEQQKEYIKSLCDSYLASGDFIEEVEFNVDGSITWLNWVPAIIYFAMYFDFKYIDNIMLDMLLLPIAMYIGKDNQRYSCFDYVEKHVTSQMMKKKVIQNLKNGIFRDEVYSNHIKYCTKRKIAEIVDVAVGVSIDNSRDMWSRRVSIDYLIEFMDIDKFYYEVAGDLDDEALLYASEKLYQRKNDKLVELLTKRANAAEKAEHVDSMMGYLIRMGCNTGIEYYIQHIKKTRAGANEFMREKFMQSAIAEIDDVEKLPYILELVNIRFEEGFADSRFNSLFSSLRKSLSAMGEKDEKNYNKVKDELETMAVDATENLQKLNFIYVTLEELRSNFLRIHETNIDINGVQLKLGLN